MSHITKLSIKIKNLDALRRACLAKGVELVEGQKTFKWFADQKGQCDHAIRVPGNPSAYEIGVVRNNEGDYELKVDFWRGGYGLVEKVGENASGLMQEYTAQVSEEHLMAQGFTNIVREYDGVGNLVLDAQRLSI